MPPVNTAEALGGATIVANLTKPLAEIRIAQRLLSNAGLCGAARRNALTCTQGELATMCGRRDMRGLAALALDDERIGR